MPIGRLATIRYEYMAYSGSAQAAHRHSRVHQLFGGNDAADKPCIHGRANRP